MKKINVILLAALLLTLPLAACTPASEVSSPPPTSEVASPSPSALPTVPSLVPVADEVALSVEVVEGDVLSRFASVNEFIEFEEEGYQRIIIEVSAPVKDFKWIEVVVQGNDSGGIDYDTNELFSLDELTPQKPFVVTWMGWGMLPHRGISFTDENNAVRRFYVNISGESGALMLVEF